MAGGARSDPVKPSDPVYRPRGSRVAQAPPGKEDPTCPNPLKIRGGWVGSEITARAILVSSREMF